jgi:4-carboxymuconolactone decarboxylase
MSEDGRLEAGTRVRMEVLGEAHVRRSLEAASEFTRPMQEFATEYCWGAVWARPGLPRRERSLINLAMLAALGRSHELAVHVRGAIRNGCTQEEIQETLLQVAAYAGVPAGMEAFRVAEAALEGIAREERAATDGKPRGEA